MICRTDPRVKEEHELRARRRARKAAAHYEYSDHAASTSKSCLTIPGINNHKRERRSHAAISSNDSTATDHSFNSVHISHTTNPLLNTSNQITKDWYMDDASVESAQPTSERFNLADINPPPVEAMPNLLQLPVPINRGPNARRQHARTHAYMGEMEPQGMRGQEAQVTQQPQYRSKSRPLKTSVPTSNFDEDDSLFSGVVEVPETPTKNSKSGYSVISGLTSLSPSSARYYQAHRPFKQKTMGYVSETRDRLEMIQNNIAEIAREDQERQPPSPLHPTTPNSRSVMSGTQSLTSSKQLSQPSPPSFRSSAPVDLDDSSFTDPIQHVQGIHAMAMEHVLRGEYEMASEAFSQVLQVYLKQYGKAHALTASSYHNLGTVHAKRAGLKPQNSTEQHQCHEQALLCFQAAARSARDAPDLGATHPNVAVSLVRIGFLLLQTKQYQNAIVTFGEALRIRKVHYGHFHPLVANLCNNLGVCHMHLQEFPKGRQYLEQALEIQRQLLQRDSSNNALLELADTLCNIGGLCLERIRQQGPHSDHAVDAERSFSEALHIRTRVLGENHSLAEQVRDLLDLVRSIPMPKQTNAIQAPRSPGGRSTATTTVHTNVAPQPMYPQYNVPVTNTKSPGRGQQSVASGGLNNSEKLQMPELHSEFSRAVMGVSDRSPQVEESNQGLRPRADASFKPGSHLAGDFDDQMSKEEESMIEAEENCLLQPEGAGQTSRLISYAQTASKYTAYAQKQNDRSALLSSAREILNTHSDSPLRTLGAREMALPAPSTQRRNTSQDEGLAPLGGQWPGSNSNRITPGVLENPDGHLNTIYNCATSFLKRVKYVEALHLLDLIAECQRNKHGPMHEDVAAALYNVGICHLRMNQYYNALQSFEEATRIRQNILGRDSVQVAASLVKVGVALLQLKRLEDSVWIFREALSVRKSVLGNLHPLTARVYNNIGCVLVELTQYDQALEAFESALKIQRNVLTHNPMNGPALFAVATTLQNMGFWYQRRGMHGKAVNAMTEALQFQEKVLGPSHGTVLETLDSIAEACLVGANTSLALKFYKEALGRLDSRNSTVEEAAILYKISRVNLQNNELESQMYRLQMASKVLQSDASNKVSEDRIELQRLIEKDLKTSTEMMEKPNLNWV